MGRTPPHCIGTPRPPWRAFPFLQRLFLLFGLEATGNYLQHLQDRWGVSSRVPPTPCSLGVSVELCGHGGPHRRAGLSVRAPAWRTSPSCPLQQPLESEGWRLGGDTGQGEAAALKTAAGLSLPATPHFLSFCGHPSPTQLPHGVFQRLSRDPARCENSS